MLIVKKTPVINVNGKASFIKLAKPLLKLFLFISFMSEKVCLIECKKQKYTVNAINGPNV